MTATPPPPYNDEATIGLYELAEHSTEGVPINLEQVRQLVDNGANVNWQPERASRPTLVSFLSTNHYDTVQFCLTTTTRPINFDVAHISSGFTVLQRLCLVDDGDLLALQQMTSLLQAIVHRLELNPRDTIDWGKKDRLLHMEFIQHAARSARLSAYYPIVKRMPYYDDKTKPIDLWFVFEEDWNGLSKEEQECFAPVEIRPGGGED